MANDEEDDDDFGDDEEVQGDLEEIDGIEGDGLDDLELELDKTARSRDARRRLELLKEEMELARLISDDYDSYYQSDS